MTDLPDKLADLSARVGDIEARAQAFKTERAAKRDRKVAEMRADLAALRGELHTAIEQAGGEIAAAWRAVDTDMHARLDDVRAHIEEEAEARDAIRADRFELNAALAIDFAMVALEDAELAVSEAIDARLRADAKSP